MIQAAMATARVTEEAARVQQAERLAREEAAQIIKEERQRKAAISEATRMAYIDRMIEQAAEKTRLLEIKKKEALAAEEKWRSSDRSYTKAFNEAVAKWAEKQRILTKPS
jgi:hypothetical protein